MKLSHTSRRRRRRAARHVIHTDLLILDLNPDEILAELDPNWFQSDKVDESAPSTERAA